METIIGLIFILLPVIFKAIEKKFQNSDKAGQAGRIREFKEKYIDEDGNVLEEDDDEGVQEPVAEPVRINVPVQALLNQVQKPVEKQSVQVRASVKRKPVVLHEEQPLKKKESIDPKKLVIYSEIMKPKFQE